MESANVWNGSLIDKQVTTIGATWLDRQLVTQEVSLGTAGFGATVKDALRAREAFLVKQGFAQRDHDGVNLPRNLLTMLRERELETVAKNLAAESGLSYRQLGDGQSALGVYRQMISAASGRFAMLDDGLGFSLVPWRPVLEKRLDGLVAVHHHADRASGGSGGFRASAAIAEMGSGTQAPKPTFRGRVSTRCRPSDASEADIREMSDTDQSLQLQS